MKQIESSCQLFHSCPNARHSLCQQSNRALTGLAQLLKVTPEAWNPLMVYLMNLGYLFIYHTWPLTLLLLSKPFDHIYGCRFVSAAVG